MLTLLVPTRRRIDHLGRMLASFEATTTAGDTAVVFRTDDDDPATASFLARRKPDAPAFCGPRRRGYASLPTFFNEMAALAGSDPQDLLMCGNDDMTFETPGWDRRFADAAAALPDGIFVLGTRTRNERESFPFSVVSRRFVDALGHLNDPRLIWSDFYLWEIARALGRAVAVDGVRIGHAWPMRGDATWDQARHTEQAVVWADQQTYWARHRHAVAEAVARLTPLLAA